MLKKKRFALLWVVVVTSLSLVNGSSFSGVKSPIEHADKIVHFLFYFVMQLLFCYTLIKKPRPVKYVIVFFITVFYGMVIEVLQSEFTSTRSGDKLDLLANTLGALTALLFVVFLHRKKFYKSKE